MVRRVVAAIERHYNRSMLVLFSFVVIFAVTFYTESLVPRYLVSSDGGEIACGTAIAPQNTAVCDEPWTLDLWAGAISLLLMLTSVAGMVVLGIRRSRRVW